MPTDVWPASDAATVTIFCSSSCQLAGSAMLREPPAPGSGLIAPNKTTREAGQAGRRCSAERSADGGESEVGRPVADACAARGAVDPESEAATTWPSGTSTGRLSFTGCSDSRTVRRIRQAPYRRPWRDRRPNLRADRTGGSLDDRACPLRPEGWNAGDHVGRRAGAGLNRWSLAKRVRGSARRHEAIRGVGRALAVWGARRSGSRIGIDRSQAGKGIRFGS